MTIGLKIAGTDRKVSLVYPAYELSMCMKNKINIYVQCNAF